MHSITLTLRENLIKADTMSDWTQRPLDQSQLYYAAVDAYVTRKIFLKCAQIILTRAPYSTIEPNYKLYETIASQAKKDNAERRKKTILQKDIEKDIKVTYRIMSSPHLDNYLRQTTMKCEGFEF